MEKGYRGTGRGYRGRTVKMDGDGPEDSGGITLALLNCYGGRVREWCTSTEDSGRLPLWII